MSVLFFFCFILTTSTAPETYSYDMNGKHVTYYPESLVLSLIQSSGSRIL